jgi:hypothetical protein
VSLRRIADVGPDRRDIHDAFTTTDERTPYPALWGHQTDHVQTMAQSPNQFLSARVRAARGRNLRDANLMWSRSGRLVIAERLWLTTTRLVSLRMTKRVLSNTWWPVALSDNEIESAVLEKVMVLWFNSSLGLLTMIAARVDTRGAWVEVKKPVLEELQVLDPRALSSSSRSKLCEEYDELCHCVVGPLPAIATDPVRARIDAAIARALNLHDNLEEYRVLLGAEPLLSGHIPGE